MAVLFTLCLKCGPFYDRHCLKTQYMNTGGVWPLSLNLRLGCVQVKRFIQPLSERNLVVLVTNSTV